MGTPISATSQIPAHVLMYNVKQQFIPILMEAHAQLCGTQGMCSTETLVMKLTSQLPIQLSSLQHVKWLVVKFAA